MSGDPAPMLARTDQSIVHPHGRQQDRLQVYLPRSRIAVLAIPLVLVLLIAPQAAATLHAPPYNGTFGMSTYVSTGSCAKTHYGVAPHYNRSTATLRWALVASSHYCAAPNYGGLAAANDRAIIDIPMPLAAGPHSINSTVSIDMGMRESFNSSGYCPLFLNSSGSGSSRCWEEGKASFQVEMMLIDLTAHTYQAPIPFITGEIVSSYENDTTCIKHSCSSRVIATGGTHNQSAVSTQLFGYFNQTFKKGHYYDFEVLVNFIVVTACYGYTGCIAKADVNAGTAGRSIQILSIGIT